jgi:soluble lytic murein transglycosylase
MEHPAMRRLLFLFWLLSVPFAWAQQDRSLSEQFVLRYARHYQVQPELIAAFIDVESGWNPHALSNAGAMGLMQLMPETARRFGAFQPFDPEQNIAAGVRYVTSLMWEFRGDLRLVAAAYYAGDRLVGREQLAYSNPEVIAYVEAVRRHYQARMHAAASLPRR